MHLLPVCPNPDAQEGADLRAQYLRRFGKEITDEEVYAILQRAMRFIWAVNLPPDYGEKESGSSRLQRGKGSA